MEYAQHYSYIGERTVTSIYFPLAPKYTPSTHIL